jgi:hypothetical protein
MPRPAPLALVALLCLALPLAAQRPAAAESLVEPGSGAGFSVRREIHGHEHTVVGVALKRVYLVFKAYATAFYVADDGRAAFRKLVAATPGGLKALQDSAKLLEWLTGGDWGRAQDFVMLRDIDKGMMKEAIRWRLKMELDLEAHDIKRIADKFFAAIDIPLRKGQRFTVMQAPHHEILAILDGKVLVKVRSRRVAAAIWRTNFGPKAPEPPLKKALVAHLENLLK